MKVLKIVLGFMIAIIFVVNLIILQPENATKAYECDYKVLSFSTKIETTDKNDTPVTIEGGSIFLKRYEDPLTMVSETGIEVAKADDDFNFLTQNDHAIIVDNNLLYTMIGEFKLLVGDKYTIKNVDGEVVGEINFNILGTVGKLFDVDGNLVAQYNSAFGRRDYIVSILETNTFDENAIHMMFASYASDRSGDASASN